MYNSRQSKEYYEEHRFDKVYKHKTADFYTCSAYDLKRSCINKVCSQHFIRTAVIRELVLDGIRSISGYVRENETDFVEKVREASNVKQAETAKAHKKQFAKNERRIAELDNLFRKVYEDNANGKLSDERYNQLSGAYEREQGELKQQNIELQSELDSFNADSVKADRFIEIVRHYTEFEKLTTPMLNEFINKILVYESDKSSGERVQQVDIHFNFIGNFIVPREEAPPTPEELETQEKLREKRAKQREANKRWYAKKMKEAERLRAEQAGELPPPTAEEIEAAEREKMVREQAERKRIEKRSKYQRDWMRQRREQERTEKSAKKSDETA